MGNSSACQDMILWWLTGDKLFGEDLSFQQQPQGGEWRKMRGENARWLLLCVTLWKSFINASLSTFYNGKIQNLPILFVLMLFELISNAKRQRYTKFTYRLWVCGPLVEPTISYLNYQNCADSVWDECPSDIVFPTTRILFQMFRSRFVFSCRPGPFSCMRMDPDTALFF